MSRRCRVPYYYSLQNKTNLADVRSWEIYNDFLEICKLGDFREMNAFHDKHIRPYEHHLRREHPDLIFTDMSLYNPYNPGYAFVKIDTPVYPRLMDALQETMASRRPATERVYQWFVMIRRLQ